MGTCFGSYVVMHTAEFGGDLMAGGVSIHPSHVSMMENHGEDAAEVYSHITSPQYFMATGETSDSLRPGGLAEEILETVGGGCIEIVARLPFLQTYFDEYRFPCIHGYFNRGDLTVPGVEKCVNASMDHLITFMEAYVVGDNSTLQ